MKDIPKQSPPFRVLCVDDDADFLEYVSLCEQEFHITLDKCGSVKEATKKLRDGAYDAYIVDLKLPDGSGFQLLDAIRRIGKAPIAVVSGVQCDEDTFRTLKEKYGVEYVLDKPVYLDQLERLFSVFCRKEQLAPEDKFKDLKRDYDKKIVDKIDKLTKLVQAVQHRPDKETFTALKEAVHKIGGSAGSYGYPHVTEVCKELEQEILHKLNGGAKADKSWLHSLDNFLHSVKYHFQISTPQASELEEGLSAIPGARTMLYIVDSDEKFLSLLEREKAQFPIEVACEPDPQAAMAQLKSPGFSPRIVLVAHRFPGSTITGFDIIEATRKKERFLPTNFGILFETESIDVRIEAAKSDVKFIFHKPISPRSLLAAMSETFESERIHNLKVLVLDDDPEMCDFVSSSLNEIGVEVRALSEPKQLYPALEEYMPHILLLDILLPKYDGLNLLKTLRADLVYRHLGIVIITHWKDPLVELKAAEDHADEIYYKPFDKATLQARVMDLARQLTLAGRFFPAQKMTGLAPYPALTKKLRETLIKHTPESKQLALFEIDRFSDLVLQIGRSKANERLIAISNALLGAADYTMSCFFFEPSRFAVFFEDHDTSTVEKKMRKLLANIRRDAVSSETYSCSIVPIEDGSSNVHMIISEAERGLAEARINEDPAPVKVFVSKLEGAKARKKEVVLIDPDEGLLRLVKMALEPYDIDVKMFTNGEEALHELFHNGAASPPALIITERKIDDMDGLDILHKVNERFHHPVPLFFLTLYASDKDVSEGLNEGAKEYIAKPFNLSLLVQKALKTVFK